MKRKTTAFALLLAVFICGSLTLQAQEKEGDGANDRKRETVFVEGHLNRLKADVELTAEQESEIKELLTALLRDRDSIHKQTGKNSKEKIREKKLIHDVFDQRLYAILTEEQQLQLQQKAKERIEAGLETIKNLSKNSQ